VTSSKNPTYDNSYFDAVLVGAGIMSSTLALLISEVLPDINILILEKLNDFKDNDTVNLDSLVKKGLIFKPKFPLKILGNGQLNVKLKVQAHAFTKVAKQKIEDAGGSCELINNK